MARRAKVVSTLTGGVSVLFRKNKIELDRGRRRRSPTAGTVRVGEEELAREARSCSRPARSRARVGGIEFGGRIIGTEEAWALSRAARARSPSSAPAPPAPRSPRPTRGWAPRPTSSRCSTACCPTEDADISKVVGRGLARQGIHVHTATAIENVKSGAGRRSASPPAARRSRSTGSCSRPGAAPTSPGSASTRPRSRSTERGLIAVDGAQRTSREGVYAIGDLTAGPALAHKASDEGIIAVEAAAGLATAPARPHRHPARDLLHAERRELRPDRGAGARGGPRRRRRQGSLRRGRRRHRSTATAAGIVKIVGERRYGELLGGHIVGTARDRADPGARQRARARGRLRGGRAHRARPPDAVGGGARSRPRRRRLADPRVAACR